MALLQARVVVRWRRFLEAGTAFVGPNGSGQGLGRLLRMLVMILVGKTRRVVDINLATAFPATAVAKFSGVGSLGAGAWTSMVAAVAPILGHAV